MTLRRLSARARLTALYTALVAACGGILVTTTYLLVSRNLQTGVLSTTNAEAPLAFMQKCQQDEAHNVPIDADTKAKCASLFAQGVKTGVLAQRNATLEHLLWYSLTALVGVTVLAAVVGWLLAGRILRPVHQLTIAARNASENNLSQRLALTGPRDELRELADTFDDMLARLGEAFAGQQRFLANASHELRTPLTVMRTTLDVVLAKSAPTNAELVAMGNEVRSSVEAAEHLIASLLTLARNERGRTIDLPIDLATTAEDVLDALPTDGLTTTVDLKSAPVFGDPILLERLVANLVDNAVRYNVPVGTITVASGAQNDHSFVRVSNTGTLIPPELVGSLFHPFTRLDDRTRHDGFGLGLALVASIASIHDAHIEAIAGAAGGLDITVRFIQATLPIGVDAWANDAFS